MTTLSAGLLLPGSFSAPAVTATMQGQPPPAPEDPGGQGADFGKSAPMALVILLLFFLAVALLVRSMNKHLRRIPESFDNDDGKTADEPPRE